MLAGPRHLAAASAAAQSLARGLRRKSDLAFQVSRASYDATFAAATHAPERDEFWLDVARREAGLRTQGGQGAARPPWPGDSLGSLYSLPVEYACNLMEACMYRRPPCIG